MCAAATAYSADTGAGRDTDGCVVDSNSRNKDSQSQHGHRPAHTCNRHKKKKRECSSKCINNSNNNKHKLTNYNNKKSVGSSGGESKASTDNEDSNGLRHSGVVPQAPARSISVNDRVGYESYETANSNLSQKPYYGKSISHKEGTNSHNHQLLNVIGTSSSNDVAKAAQTQGSGSNSLRSSHSFSGVTGGSHKVGPNNKSNSSQSASSYHHHRNGSSHSFSSNSCSLSTSTDAGIHNTSQYQSNLTVTPTTSSASTVPVDNISSGTDRKLFNHSNSILVTTEDLSPPLSPTSATQTWQDALESTNSDINSEGLKKWTSNTDNISNNAAESGNKSVGSGGSGVMGLTSEASSPNVVESLSDAPLLDTGGDDTVAVVTPMVAVPDHQDHAR